jgi:hypothetical protein
MASGRTCPLSNKVNADVFGDGTAGRTLSAVATSGESPDGSALSGDDAQDSNAAAAAAACSAIRTSGEMLFVKRILITIPFLECSAV